MKTERPPPQRASGHCGSPDGGRELVEGCLDQDDRAWERLFAHAWSICLRVTARVLGRQHGLDAEDAAQEALVAAFQHLEAWNGRSLGTLEAWFCTIAARQAWHFRKRIDRWSLDEKRAPLEVDASRRIHAAEQARRRLEEMTEAIGERLSERQKRVLEGRLAGQSQRELAAALGVARSVVRNEIKAIGEAARTFPEIFEE